MIKNKKDSDNPEAQGIVEALPRENKQKGRWYISPQPGSEEKNPEAHHPKLPTDLHNRENVSFPFWVLIHTGNKDLTLYHLCSGARLWSHQPEEPVSLDGFYSYLYDGIIQKQNEGREWFAVLSSLRPHPK